ncbi:MAG: SMC-Scp complex subunit ScpB [Actinomycetota bacterium]|nr:SMC-Scp complex subunit ScpB [Actinomycetota bacterium]
MTQSAREVPQAPKAASLPLQPALEAVLLVVDEPVPATMLAPLLGADEATVTAALVRLADEYEAAERGFELRCVAGGWRLYTRPGYAELVEQFLLSGQQTRLSQASLETLAVIAYRQPVSRARVAAVRGVNVDGVVRTLMGRGLLDEVGTDPDTGAVLYGTSALFLTRLGLTTVDELPSLAPLLPELVDVEEG